MKTYNRLGQEKSPYLLQHKDNPVHWFPWGEEAFKAAREENKPIFLSIGYSTCYWCHVMEKDSFERKEVGDALNKDFIAIKVDREERPDVDTIYMDAVTALTGHGGWPMSVFLTPDLKPFYGGTFFYRAQFLKLLEQLTKAWEQSPKDIQASAEKLTTFLKEREQIGQETNINEESLKAALVQLHERFDPRFGGFGEKPKFPPAVNLSLLLRIHRRTENESALKMTQTTLEHMARGGIYDHLGGGFHRYSTDNSWLIPHFEKMLYDNALLAFAYLEAFQVTKNEMFASVARETLDYVLRDMRSDEGGFYSAEDAGEVGKEGEFYVFKYEELESTLTEEELKELIRIYGVTTEGNFEDNYNILHLGGKIDWKEKKTPLVRSIHKKLLSLRAKRKRPHLDDKILTAWNALMISALSKGYQVLGEERYLQAGTQAAILLKEKLYQNGKLLRRYRDGEARFPGYIDDYAFLIQALLHLYESDGNESWIRFAVELQETQDKIFWDTKNSGYFFSDPKDSSIILRKKDFTDGAKPSGNGIAALNLLRLYDFTFEKKYKDKFQKLLGGVSGLLTRYPSAFGATLLALDYHLDRSKEIVVVGDTVSGKGKSMREYLQQTFLPNKVLAFGKPADIEETSRLPLFRGKQMLGGVPTVYVCENNTCKLPTNDLQEAQKLVNELRKY